MRYGAIPGVGDHLSRVVLGCLVFASSPELVDALVVPFLERGGNVIDTARQYGDSERAVGAWLRYNPDRRAQLTIITKGAHHTPDGAQRVTPEAIDEDLLESRDALGIETIDLYLLHRDDPSKPVGPIVECLNRHVDVGHIRAFGASNWTHQRILEANAFASARGYQGFAAASPNLALAVTKEPMWPNCISIAGDPVATAWFRETQFPLLSWSSQASGFFSGRFAPDRLDDPNVVRVYYRDDNWERLRRARKLAGDKGCTATQIALSWVLHHEINAFALIGPRTPAELADCLGAVDVTLSPDEMVWLNLEEPA